MTTQRQQLKGAHSNVFEMREATERARMEIVELTAKRKQKKMQLQMIVVALAVTDLFLLFRLLQCGGSFFCRSS